VFRVYHGNPAATTEAIDADGWFHSGDIGHFEDGFLRITDRKKDLIVTAGGKKVAPQVLENAIKMRIPLVSEALVFGDNRPYCVALVTPSAEAFRRFGVDGQVDVAGPLRAAIAEDLQRLNATLASYETIKEFAILPQDFSEAAGEITPSFKVKRKVVIDKHRQLIDGLYKKTRD
jgi:long-chain acyl-CoA synthetase